MRAGTASGWLGGLSMLGYCAGGVLTYHIDDIGIFGAYAIIMVVHGASMVRVLCPSVPCPCTAPVQRGLVPTLLLLLLASCRVAGCMRAYLPSCPSFRVVVLGWGCGDGAQLVTVWFVAETPLPESASKPLALADRVASFLTPFSAHDFRVVFITRSARQSCHFSCRFGRCLHIALGDFQVPHANGHLHGAGVHAGTL